MALALSLPAVSAEKMMWLAWDLEVRPPGIGGLLAAGLLTSAKAKAVNEAFESVGDDDAARAEALILSELPGKTYGQAAKLAAQAAITVDPESATRRREDAEQNKSRVQMFREESGAAALSGRDLPTDQTLAARASVCARAQDYKDSGMFPKDTRMDQFRVAAYLDLLNGIPATARIASGQVVTVARAGATTEEVATRGSIAPIRRDRAMTSRIAEHPGGKSSSRDRTCRCRGQWRFDERRCRGRRPGTEEPAVLPGLPNPAARQSSRRGPSFSKATPARLADTAPGCSACPAATASPLSSGRSRCSSVITGMSRTRASRTAPSATWCRSATESAPSRPAHGTPGNPISSMVRQWRSDGPRLPPPAPSQVLGRPFAGIRRAKGRSREHQGTAGSFPPGDPRTGTQPGKDPDYPRPPPAGAIPRLSYPRPAQQREAHPRRRSANGIIALQVPPDAIKARCARCRQHGKPWHRPELQNLGDYNIVRIYGAEYAGVVNYYVLAQDVGRLRALRWNAETSMLKTLAAKHHSTAIKMAARYKAKIETSDGLRTCFEARKQREGGKELTARCGGISLRQNRRAVIHDLASTPTPYPRKELENGSANGDASYAGPAQRWQSTK